MTSEASSLSAVLQPERIGLVGTVGIERRLRRHGLSFREPDPGIELPRQLCLEIMREELGLRPVDDADSPLKQGFGKVATNVVFLSRTGLEEEGRNAGIARATFIGVVAGSALRIELLPAVPGRRRGDRAVVRAEADQRRVLAEMVAR